MAVRNDLTRLLAKASQDINFRARLLKEPLLTAACLGIALNAGQATAAKNLHEQTAQPAAATADSDEDVAFLIHLPRVPRLIPLG